VQGRPHADGFVGAMLAVSVVVGLTAVLFN
jgi:hypothetical protein